ncbi:MAG: anti-sigma factor [Deltaproteobacteria bacterium]|nr:anti-sigma factor [Deltaproteobacteria bacterium]
MSADHTEMVERLSPLLEGELPPDEQQALETHLEGCEDCRQQYEALRRTTEALRSLQPHRAPADLEARVRRRVRRRDKVHHLPRPPTWPQELLSAAVLAVIVGATVTLSGRILVPGGDENLSGGPAATGLFGDRIPDVVEVRFAAGDEGAARAVVAAAADLGARTLGGAPLRPGEPLSEVGMAFTLPKEALAVIVPDGIAEVVAVPDDEADPRPPAGWMLVRVRVSGQGP